MAMSTDHSRKKLLKDYPNLKEVMPFLDSLSQESARGKVLISCSFTDEQLRELISVFLVEDSDSGQLLEGFNAPLSTFSTRTIAAHCLGLITDTERDDCDTFRRIRNEFAHNHKAAFTDTKIIDLCKNLHASAKDYGEVVVGSQGQFTTAAVGLILNFTNRPHYVIKSRLTLQSWPY